MTRPELDTGSHDLPVTSALEAFMARDWAEPLVEDPDLAPVAAWAAKRRARLSECFPGERIVVPSGSYLGRSNDQDYRFRAHSDHVWLTGSQLSDAVLVLEPMGNRGHEATLYLRPRADRRTSDEFWRDRRYGELWAGRRPSLAEVAARLDLPTRHLDDLPAVPALDGATDPELAAVLSELRLVKDPWEIEQLTDAVDITVRGFTDVVRELPRAVELGERWIEGTFWRRARLEGNDVGYSCIVAGGAHATTLHWIDNDGPVRPGELLLLDMGAENRSLYTADVTRTLPVSGTFTPLQRDLYTLEFRAQEAGIAAVRPNARFRDFHNAAMAVLAHGLADLGLLPCSAAEALDEDSTVYRRWTLCGSGHMLGLDVHDCAAARAGAYLDGVLQPGHVLTVEPGIYLQAEDLLLPEEMRGIGIRIEDDLVVTDNGARLLSGGLPRSPDEIETWLASVE
ncbi:MAG: aminopeptidase P family protein [Actinomycetota bacterium]|nr:aminopeptidase P family protein [Actinomycetota bacterium]